MVLGGYRIPTGITVVYVGQVTANDVSGSKLMANEHCCRSGFWAPIHLPELWKFSIYSYACFLELDPLAGFLSGSGSTA